MEQFNPKFDIELFKRLWCHADELRGIIAKNNIDLSEIMEGIRSLCPHYVIKPIAKYEEICINYNGQYNDNTPVWFDVK